MAQRKIKIVGIEKTTEERYKYTFSFTGPYSSKSKCFIESDKNLSLGIDNEYLGEFVLTPGIKDFIEYSKNDLVTMSEDLEKIIDKESEEVIWKKR